MSVLSQFQAGRPAKVSVLTGAGTFTPLATPCWVRVTAVGGGCGGQRPVATSNGGVGGGGGATVMAWLRLESGQTVPYAVGAAGVGGTTSGTRGTDGGLSLFGSLIASSGRVGIFSGASDIGGTVGFHSYLPETYHLPTNTGPSGVPGGYGGLYSAFGGAAGSPVFHDSILGSTQGTAAGGATNTYTGGGGGGDSLYGMGGAGGDGSATTGANGANATGYGAGGGGGGGGTTSGNGGAGSPGTIIVEEFPTSE